MELLAKDGNLISMDGGLLVKPESGNKEITITVNTTKYYWNSIVSYLENYIDNIETVKAIILNNAETYRADTCVYLLFDDVYNGRHIGLTMENSNDFRYRAYSDNIQDACRFYEGDVYRIIRK